MVNTCFSELGEGRGGRRRGARGRGEGGEREREREGLIQVDYVLPSQRGWSPSVHHHTLLNVKLAHVQYDH